VGIKGFYGRKTEEDWQIEGCQHIDFSLIKKEELVCSEFMIE